MLNSFRLFVLVVSFVAVGAMNALAQPKKYALLVGVNEYDHAKLPKLDYAVNDATVLAALLTKHGYEVSVLTDASTAKPTKKNIESALDELLGKYKKNDTVIVGFAGHGLQFGKDCYFCPSDAKPFDTQTQTMVSLTAMYKKLEESYDGVKLVLVDACRDDGKRGIRGGADGTPLPPKGVGVLLSCSDGEHAYEHKDLKHGVFFYHVIKGLEGAADQGKSGKVTWDSLRAYVKEQVPLAVPKLFQDNTQQRPNEMGNLSGAPPVLIALPTVEQSNPRIVRAKDPKLDRVIEYLIYDLGRGVDLKLVKVPVKGKPFTIGSSKQEQQAVVQKYYEGTRPDWMDSEDLHEINFTSDYYIGHFEVTRGQFRQFVGETGYMTEAEGGEGGVGWNESKKEFEGRNKKYSWRNTGFAQTDEHPVVLVTWNDAKRFCSWMEKKGDGKVRVKEVRLPGEAEWEYACRAGSTTRFSFGDDEERVAEYGNAADKSLKEMFPNWQAIKARDGYVFTAPVAKFKPNDLGLYDMHGNVWEWCEDFYGKYAELPKGNNQIQTTKQQEVRRVLRGGSWIFNPWFCRSAYRRYNAPDFSNYIYGFRVAVVPLG